MAKFDKVVRALTQGHSVRRDKWEPIIRVFLSSDTLMCQRGSEKPWQCALSWDEIVATDWHLFKDESTTRQVKQAISTMPLPFALRATRRALPDSLKEASTR